MVRNCKHVIRVVEHWGHASGDSQRLKTFVDNSFKIHASLPPAHFKTTQAKSISLLKNHREKREKGQHQKGKGDKSNYLTTSSQSKEYFSPTGLYKHLGKEKSLMLRASQEMPKCFMHPLGHSLGTMPWNTPYICNRSKLLFKTTALHKQTTEHGYQEFVNKPSADCVFLPLSCTSSINF